MQLRTVLVEVALHFIPPQRLDRDSAGEVRGRRELAVFLQAAADNQGLQPAPAAASIGGLDAGDPPFRGDFIQPVEQGHDMLILDPLPGAGARDTVKPHQLGLNPFAQRGLVSCPGRKVEDYRDWFGGVVRGPIQQGLGQLVGEIGGRSVGDRWEIGGRSVTGS